MYGETLPGREYMVAFADNYSDGVVILVGPMDLQTFGEAVIADLAAGRTVIDPDIAANNDLPPLEREAYAAIGVGAQVAVPLLDGDHLAAVLAVHQTSPHVWSVEQVTLIEQTAERTWAAVDRTRSERAPYAKASIGSAGNASRSSVARHDHAAAGADRRRAWKDGRARPPARPSGGRARLDRGPGALGSGRARREPVRFGDPARARFCLPGDAHGRVLEVRSSTPDRGARLPRPARGARGPVARQCPGCGSRSTWIAVPAPAGFASGTR